MDKKILITGATGLIGSNIVNELITQGAFVKILTTNPASAQVLFKKHFALEIFDVKKYDDPVSLSHIINNTDAVINLAGANVAGKRWSMEFKKIVYDSRIETTRLIVEAISYAKNKPSCFLSASGVGIYGFRGNEIIYEDSELGEDFLAKLCREWEMEAMKAIQYDVRVVNIRTGIVLDKNGGALKEFLTPFKFYVGVYQGSGNQWLSWIHIEDIIRLYIFSMENENILGTVNGVSPDPVTNKDFTKLLGKILNKNIIVPVPGFILKLALGEFAENLLTGQKCSPKKIIDHGFKFKFPFLKEALENLLNIANKTEAV